MSLLDTLQNDMKAAMKAGSKERLSALRMLVSAVRYAGIDQGDMTDEKVLSVLAKEAKKRRESIEAYAAAGRTESAESERQELAIIETYLPARMSEDDVRAKAADILKNSSFPNFGAAMGAVMRELKGQADGGVVSKVVKELYQ